MSTASLSNVPAGADALTPAERDALLVKQTHVLEEVVEENTKLRVALELFTRNDAHAVLRSVYSNEALPLHQRLDAAKAAIKYERPAFEAVPAPSADRNFAERLKRARLKVVGARAG